MKFLSWGPGGFHSFYNLIHKRARIWVTTIVVLAMVAFYVMFQAVSGLSTANYANQRIYNTSEAGGLQLRYNNRLLSVFEKIKQILSPNSNQIPATVTPNVGTGNNATGGSGSTGNVDTTAGNSNNSNTTTDSGNGTGGSTASVTANNPSIFTQQNQGPSAPKFITGARLHGVSPDLSWTVQGQVTGGQIGNVVQGKDFVALYHQWVQYNNSGSNPIRMWENSGANLPRPGHLPGLVFTVNWGDGKSNTGWMLPPTEADLNSDLGIGDNSGGATTTIGHGNDLPHTKHIYASAGVYAVTAKACYLSHNPFNDASKNDPNIIIRNPEKFLATGPLDGRCSPEASYTMKVLTPEVFGKGGALGANNLFMQLAPNSPNQKTAKGYPIYKAGNNIPMGIVRITNIGTSAEILNSIGIAPSGDKLPEINGDGSCCHVSIHQARLKMNGSIIGDIPMQWRNPQVGVEVMRFSQPISLVARQSIDLSLYGDAHVDRTFANFGKSDENRGWPRGDDIEQYGGVGVINLNSPQTDFDPGVGSFGPFSSYGFNLSTFEIDNNGDTPGSIATE